MVVMSDDGTTVGPRASGGVFSEKKQASGGDGDQDEGNDERHAPCDVRRETTFQAKRVVDGRHDKAGPG